MSAPKKQAETLPAFHSDRMLLLGPLVTPRALEIARMRVADHKLGVDTLKDDTATLRIALALLMEMFPWVTLSAREEGILRGVHHETIGKMKARGEI